MVPRAWTVTAILQPKLAMLAPGFVTLYPVQLVVEMALKTEPRNVMTAEPLAAMDATPLVCANTLPG